MPTCYSPKSTTCCFTGHRPNKLPWKYNESDPRCVSLKKKLYDVAYSLYQSGYRHFICGMAQGCDMYFCEIMMQLRGEHSDITIEAAIPCETQSAHWPEEQRLRYFKLISECDKETLLQTAYTPSCMQKRNKYMVDNSSAIIAVFDGSLGGTMQTLAYALRSNIDIIELQP